VEITEEPWGAGEGAALVAALTAELDLRYADGVGPAGAWPISDEGWSWSTDLGRLVAPPEPTALAPAPVAAAPDDPAWDVAAEAVRRPLGAFVVARSEGRPIGCGALRRLPGGDPAVGEIKRMYIVPAARGRGAARTLLAHLVAIARELELRSLVLETGTRQPEAIALYLREGWVPLAPYGEYRQEPLSRCYALDLGPRA